MTAFARVWLSGRPPRAWWVAFLVVLIAAPPLPAAAGPRPRLTIRLEPGSLPDVAFVGGFIALASQDAPVKLFDAASGDPAREVATPVPRRALAVAGESFLTTTFSGPEIYRFDAATGALGRTYVVPSGAAPAALAVDGDRLLAGSTLEDGRAGAYLFDLASSDVLRTFALPDGVRRARSVDAVAFASGVPILGVLFALNDSVAVLGTRIFTAPWMDVRYGLASLAGDLFVTAPGNDLPDEQGGSRRGKVYQLDPGTGSVRRTFVGRTTGFGGLVPIGDRGFLAGDVTENGGGVIYQIDAASGETVQRLEGPPGRDVEFGARLAASASEALVLVADPDHGSFVNVYALPSCPARRCADEAPVESLAGANGKPAIRAGCRAGRGRCVAVARTRDGTAVTRRVSVARQRHAERRITLALNRAGQVLLAATPDGRLAVELTLRLTDGTTIRREKTEAVVLVR
jgi:hypothetical protein